MSKIRTKGSAIHDLGYPVTVLCGILSMGLLAYFAATTVYSSDDYWYSTFWDQGLGHYLELLRYHYREFNGRTLVHMLAHAILHFKNWTFVLACCGLCLAAVWTECWAAGLEKKRTAAAACLFLMGILLMPTSFFTQGVMWISAFCNYVFPVVLVCILIAMLERKRNCLLLFAAAFLCGATTEQMGLTTVAVAMLFVIDAGIRKDGVGRCLACAGFAGAGVLTIFLSPATQNRASSQMRQDTILADIQRAIRMESELLTENPMPVILMLAFFLLAGQSLWRSSGKKWMFPVCGCGAAALAAGCAGTGAVRSWGFVICFAALAVLATALIAARQRCAGGLMLAALASAAVMLPTNTIFSRVMVPFYLLMLLSVCILAAKAYQDARCVSAACLLCMAIVIVSLVPAFRGYWYNYQIDLRNEAYAMEDREKAELRYCADYNTEFTWMKPYDDAYFRLKYLESIGMPEDTGVRFISAQDAAWPKIYCDDRWILGNSMVAEDGKVMMPLREIVEHFGGTVSWTVEYTVVSFDQREYRMANVSADTMDVSFTDQNGQIGQRSIAQGVRYGNKYVELAFFSELLGLSIQFDEERFCYILTS